MDDDADNSTSQSSDNDERGTEPVGYLMLDENDKKETPNTTYFTSTFLYRATEAIFTQMLKKRHSEIWRKSNSSDSKRVQTTQ